MTIDDFDEDRFRSAPPPFKRPGVEFFSIAASAFIAPAQSGYRPPDIPS